MVQGQVRFLPLFLNLIHSNMDNIKITADGFVWLIVTDVAEKLYYSNAMEVYRLYDDGTEARINDFRDLQDALAVGNDIGVEIGPLQHLNYSYKHQHLEQ
jgi:hypothetical protein